LESEKKISVCLTLDFDAISLWIGGFGARSLSAISRGEFGRVGAERLIAMLREWGIRSTWFVPGHSAETYPQIVERLVAGGHEIAHHGYLHTHPKSPEDEAAILDRGSEVLTRMTGRRPLGFRSPGAGLSYNMVELLRDRGFVYDSSLMGDDFSPYYLRSGDEAPTDGPYIFGKSIDVVEIPFTWGLDDFPAFEYVTSRAGIQPGLSSPSAVFRKASRGPTDASACSCPKARQACRGAHTSRLSGSPQFKAASQASRINSGICSRRSPNSVA